MAEKCAFCGGHTDTLKVIDEAGRELIFCNWICLRSYLLMKTKRYH